MNSKSLFVLVSLALLQVQAFPAAQAQAIAGSAKTIAVARPLAAGQLILLGAWRSAPAATGLPSRPYALRFGLYDAPEGGQLLAPPVERLQPVDGHGQVSQTMDFGAAVEAGRWLQLSVLDEHGLEMAMAPRLPLDGSLNVQRLGAGGHALDATVIRAVPLDVRVAGGADMDQAPRSVNGMDGLEEAGGYGEFLNISTRGYVGTGDSVMIAGFIVDEPSVVMIRALGPSLAASGVPGVLPDPTLEVFHNSQSMAFNDDFPDSTLSVTVAKSLNLLPRNNREAVLVQVVDRGAYTAIVRGLGGATGIGLVEVFQLGRALQPQAQVSVSNETGAALCYEILGSGIGEKCFGPGVASYGVFSVGRYNYEISAVCGTTSGVQTYSAGFWEHRVWCGPGVLGAGAALGSSLEVRPD